MVVAIAGNGLGIGDVWDFLHKRLIQHRSLIEKQMIINSTSAHILPIPC